MPIIISSKEQQGLKSLDFYKSTNTIIMIILWTNLGHKKRISLIIWLGIYFSGLTNVSKTPDSVTIVLTTT